MKAPLQAAYALGVALLVAAPLSAQETSADRAPGAIGTTWLERVSVSATFGTFRPAGRSEVFSLIERAHAPGWRALRPTLVGGELHVRVLERWRVVLGAESGRVTVASMSRDQPASAPGPVRQQTTLELTSLPYLGAEWHALRWARAGGNGADHLRVVLGAGGGFARYRLRQWGDFVDTERGIAFQDDFNSSGRGGFGYASGGLEVPVRPWIALQGELRWQIGSARMRADYSSFDRLDLGGTKLGIGVVLAPGF